MGLNIFIISTFFLLGLTHVTMGAVSPDAKVFFQDKIKGNLTKITWAHAVNNKDLLAKTLLDTSIMMIEADVIMGHVTSNLTNLIPIMAHPPNTTSDLALLDFLNSVVQNGHKGIKLDFKSLEAFEASLPILVQHRQHMTFPVWLNADILPGPVNSTVVPVNAQKFIVDASKNFPESTLSLGWTTYMVPSSNHTNGTYTKEQIQDMVNAITNVSLMITYPVRAGIAVNNDIKFWTDLLNKTPNKSSTLTIWSDEKDVVDAKKLSKLIKAIGVSKVYVDVPKDLWMKLDISAASAGKISALLMSICLVIVNIFTSKLM